SSVVIRAASGMGGSPSSGMQYVQRSEHFSVSETRRSRAVLPKVSTSSGVSGRVGRGSVTVTVTSLRLPRRRVEPPRLLWGYAHRARPVRSARGPPGSGGVPRAAPRAPGSAAGAGAPEHAPAAGGVCGVGVGRRTAGTGGPPALRELADGRLRGAVGRRGRGGARLAGATAGGGHDDGR